MDPYRDEPELLLSGSHARIDTSYHGDELVTAPPSPSPSPCPSCPSSQQPPRPPRPSIPGATWYQAQRPGSVVAVCALIMFSMMAAALLALLPMLLLLEDAICRRHFGLDYENRGRGSGMSRTLLTSLTSNGNEELCKDDAVQSQLAWVAGIIGVLESVFSLIASFPWSILADRIGRKPIFRISLIGIVGSFGWTAMMLLRPHGLSVWFLLPSALFLLLGGGSSIAMTVLYAMVADVTPDGSRTSAFVWMAMGNVSGSIVGSTAATMLMSSAFQTAFPTLAWMSSPWVPISMALLGLAPLILVLTIFLPETLQRPRGDGDRPDKTRTGLSSFSASFFFEALRNELRHRLPRQLRSCVAVLRRSRSALLMIPTFLFMPAVQSAQGTILVQTMSKRFGWSLASMGYLLSLRGVIMLASLALLPAISAMLVRKKSNDNNKNSSRSSSLLRWPSFGLSEPAKDLALARGLFLLSLVGNLLLATRWLGTTMAGLVLVTLSVGLGSVSKSLMTLFYEAEKQKSAADTRFDANGSQTSCLYTVVNVIETAGTLIAGPVLAALFSAGLSLGGPWLIGLPFFYVAVLCTLSLLFLLAIRVDRLSLPRLSLARDEDSESLHDEEEEVGPGVIAIA